MLGQCMVCYITTNIGTAYTVWELPMEKDVNGALYRKWRDPMPKIRVAADLIHSTWTTDTANCLGAASQSNTEEWHEAVGLRSPSSLDLGRNPSRKLQEENGLSIIKASNISNWHPAQLAVYSSQFSYAIILQICFLFFSLDNKLRPRVWIQKSQAFITTAEDSESCDFSITKLCAMPNGLRKHSLGTQSLFFSNNKWQNQRKKTSRFTRGGLDWILGNFSAWKELSSIGTGCHA